MIYDFFQKKVHLLVLKCFRKLNADQKMLDDIYIILFLEKTDINKT